MVHADKGMMQNSEQGLLCPILRMLPPGEIRQMARRQTKPPRLLILVTEQRCRPVEELLPQIAETAFSRGDVLGNGDQRILGLLIGDKRSKTWPSRNPQEEKTICPKLARRRS